jgi:hypothetical protein
MEPTSIYHKNKRNLFIFAGLLILVTVGGIEVKNPSTISLLPFQIKNPAMVQHVLFAITIYCAYQFYLSWFYQRDEIREKIQSDFVITIAAFLLSVSIYAFEILEPIIVRISISSESLVATAGTIFGVISAAVSARVWGELRKRSFQVFEIRQETIDQRLLKPGWILIFNPKTHAQKSISFNKDGTIGEGRNDNEFQWKMVNDELVILRSDERLQNRFRYDSMTDRFLSIDDSFAHGLRGQVIFHKELLDNG